MKLKVIKLWSFIRSATLFMNFCMFVIFSRPRPRSASSRSSSSGSRSRSRSRSRVGREAGRGRGSSSRSSSGSSSSRSSSSSSVGSADSEHLYRDLGSPGKSPVQGGSAATSKKKRGKVHDEPNNTVPVFQI